MAVSSVASMPAWVSRSSPWWSHPPMFTKKLCRLSPELTANLDRLSTAFSVIATVVGGKQGIHGCAEACSGIHTCAWGITGPRPRPADPGNDSVNKVGVMLIQRVPKVLFFGVGVG